MYGVILTRINVLTSSCGHVIRYITNIIKNQLKGTYGDYGVMLKDDTESGTTHWTTFYSSEASSPNKPELHITYNEKKFLDYGYWSSSVDIRLNTYADVWASAINNAIASWNNSGAPVYFYSIYNTTYGNDINVVNNANPWYGRLVTTGGEGNELISFYVELNSGPITTDASNLSNFIQSVLVQYLGTAIWLDEDPVTPYDSIMKNNRNRNTLIAPTQYDVQNVSSKYTN